MRLSFFTFLVLVIGLCFTEARSCESEFEEIAKHFSEAVLDHASEESLAAFSGALRSRAQSQTGLLKIDFLTEIIPHIIYEYATPRLISDSFWIVQAQERQLISMAREGKPGTLEKLVAFNQLRYGNLSAEQSLSLLIALTESRLNVGLTDYEAVPFIDAFGISYTGFTKAFPIDESQSGIFDLQSPDLSAEHSYHAQNLILDLNGVSAARAHRARTFLSFIWRHLENVSNSSDAGERHFGPILDQARRMARDPAALRNLKDSLLIVEIENLPSLQKRLRFVADKFKYDSLDEESTIEALSDLHVLELFYPLDGDGVNIYQLISVRRSPTELMGMARFLGLEAPYFLP